MFILCTSVCTRPASQFFTIFKFNHDNVDDEKPETFLMNAAPLNIFARYFSAFFHFCLFKFGTPT